MSISVSLFLCFNLHASVFQRWLTIALWNITVPPNPSWLKHCIMGNCKRFFEIITTDSIHEIEFRSARGAWDVRNERACSAYIRACMQCVRMLGHAPGCARGGPAHPSQRTRASACLGTSVPRSSSVPLGMVLQGVCTPRSMRALGSEHSWARMLYGGVCSPEGPHTWACAIMSALPLACELLGMEHALWLCLKRTIILVYFTHA